MVRQGEAARAERATAELLHAAQGLHDAHVRLAAANAVQPLCKTRYALCMLVLAHQGAAWVMAVCQGAAHSAPVSHWRVAQPWKKQLAALERVCLQELGIVLSSHQERFILSVAQALEEDVARLSRANASLAEDLQRARRRDA